MPANKTHPHSETDGLIPSWGSLVLRQDVHADYDPALHHLLWRLARAILSSPRPVPLRRGRTKLTGKRGAFGGHAGLWREKRIAKITRPKAIPCSHGRFKLELLDLLRENFRARSVRIPINDILQSEKSLGFKLESEKSLARVIFRDI